MTHHETFTFQDCFPEFYSYKERGSEFLSYKIELGNRVM